MEWEYNLSLNKTNFIRSFKICLKFSLKMILSFRDHIDRIFIQKKIQMLYFLLHYHPIIDFLIFTL